MVEPISHTGCPGCRSKPLPEKEQPSWGTHAFSRRYMCGSQVVYTVEGAYWEWETKCKELKTIPEELDDGK